MIRLITGAKGTGKTKIIIDLANDNVETAKGDIVFLTDTDRYMYSLRYQVRVINVDNFLKKGDAPISEESLIGFIKGVLAGNHDIETLYIDGAHRMLAKTIHEMEDFFRDIYSIGKDTETKFVITVSEDEDNFPEFLNKYRKEG